MQPEPAETLGDRLAYSVFGALTGAAYGCLIALGVFFMTEVGHKDIIAWSAAVFAVLGFFFGNFIIEALLSLLHFLWGLACALTEQARPIEQSTATGHLRSFMLLGFGTGLVLLLWIYF
jgi:hypothetical protein